MPYHVTALYSPLFPDRSVAFIVLDHFGLDSADYSFGYVASWQTDKDAVATLKAVGQRIQGAAKQIIDGVAEGRYELLRDWHIPEFKIM